jgi:O-antigen ligase
MSSKVSGLQQYAFGLPRQWLYLVFALLAPLSVQWPLAPVLVPAVPALYAAPALYLSDLPAAAIVVLSGLGARRLGIRSLVWPLLALAGLALASIPLALDQTLAAYTAARWLLAIGVGITLSQPEVDYEQVVAALLVGLCLHALIGIGQVARQGPLGLPGEMAVPVASEGASIIMTAQTRWLRAYGLTLHPNVLGGYLTIGLLLALPLLERRRWRLAWLLLLLGLLLSFSRAAWLAAALSLPPVASWLAVRKLALRRPFGLVLAGAALIVLAVAGALAGEMQSRFHLAAVAAEQRSLSERDDMLAVALHLIARRPLLGVGAGNFPVAMLSADTPVPPQYVHNVPLLLAAEVGALGGALWLWLWLAPLWMLWRRRRRASQWLIVLVGAWLALGVVGLWDSYPWGLPPGLLLTTALLGGIIRALQETDESTGENVLALQPT